MKKNIYFFIFTLVLVIMTSSCLKKQDLESQDLGPTINSDELQNKMGESIGQLNYADIDKSEMSTFTASTIFQDSQVTKRYKQELFVKSITNTTDTLTIDFLFNKQDYLNSESSLANQPYTMVIDKTQKMARAERDLQTKDSTKPVPYFMYRAFIYFAVQGCRENNVTCHKLKTDTSKLYVPPEIASTKVCPDVNNCFVDLKKIEFDMLDHNILDADGKAYRTHYTFKVSPQLPFLSKVLQYCVRGLADYGGRKVLAEDCMAINNFSYGQQP